MQYRGEGSGETALISVWWSQFSLLQYENKNAHLALCQCCVRISLIAGEVAVSAKHPILVTLECTQEKGYVSEDGVLYQPLWSSSRLRFPSSVLCCALLTAWWLWLTLLQQEHVSFSRYSNLYLQARDRTHQCSGALMLSLMHRMSSDEILMPSVVLRAQESWCDSDCLLACKHMQNWVGTFHFILL